MRKCAPQSFATMYLLRSLLLHVYLYLLRSLLLHGLITVLILQEPYILHQRSSLRSGCRQKEFLTKLHPKLLRRNLFQSSLRLLPKVGSRVSQWRLQNPTGAPATWRTFLRVPNNKKASVRILDCIYWSNGFRQYGSSWRPRDAGEGPERQEARQPVAPERSSAVCIFHRQHSYGRVSRDERWQHYVESAQWDY